MREPLSEHCATASSHHTQTHDSSAKQTEDAMPRGSKAKYTDKQKRMAEHIEKGYEKKGAGDKEAERRAWATVNKVTKGGKKSGSGRGMAEDHSPMRKGGQKASHSKSTSSRSEAAKKGWATRRRNAKSKK
jgi:hypothetical protein